MINTFNRNVRILNKDHVLYWSVYLNLIGQASFGMIWTFISVLRLQGRVSYDFTQTYSEKLTLNNTVFKKNTWLLNYITILGTGTVVSNKTQTFNRHVLNKTHTFNQPCLPRVEIQDCMYCGCTSKVRDTLLHPDYPGSNPIWNYKFVFN